MKKLMEIAGGKEDESEERNFVFSAKSIISGWVMIATAAFALGGIFFNAKNLPQAVQDIKIEMSAIKTDVKNISAEVSEMRRYILTYKPHYEK